MSILRPRLPEPLLSHIEILRLQLEEVKLRLRLIESRRETEFYKRHLLLRMRP